MVALASPPMYGPYKTTQKVLLFSSRREVFMSTFAIFWNINIILAFFHNFLIRVNLDFSSSHNGFNQSESMGLVSRRRNREISVDILHARMV